MTYIAPKIIGGDCAPSPVRGDGFAKMSEAVKLTNTSIRKLGDDYLIESEVIRCSQE